ncbi:MULTISPECIES: nitroreductase family protein [Idiomarina]|uniref:Putative NAD(P)H nitroreductase n=1 Tax=Idiomarina piscisalsi TaxID=1096243 RepID=A0A432YWI6_9GAMM|nr:MULTISPECIES: nitroreductase family protein [Idiomarina]MCJ8316094.1 nitroreductase family protein [Idiomarina sp.]NQZ16007.1 nitroreductase family protein [Idiomarina sp.]RUO67676.1 nitroreductase [Idiomarina piscisalsi]
MDAVELLTTRSSMPRLIEPGPSVEQLELIKKSAVRAPDHMSLAPYEFIQFQGKDRGILADIYQQAARINDFSETIVEQAGQLPFRAPLVIAACLKYQQHPKVPREEQLCTVACAAHSMQQAAFAQGLGGIWRTGWTAEDDYVKEQLGLAEDDAIVGFLYVGTPAVPTPIKPEKDAEPYFVSAKDKVLS